MSHPSQRLILMLFLCLICTTLGYGQTPTPTIHIQAGQTLGPVNQKIFGQVVRGADRKDVFSNKHDRYITNESEGLWNPQSRKPFPNALALLKGVKPRVLRYPDGLNTQGHNWKKTVGPLETRPQFRFGLDEYMQVCKAVGAEAQIVVTEYIGTAQDLADLVEYLNAPATNQYPWAQKRAKWGHPKPYGVQYFELGNESWAKKLRGRGVPKHTGQTYAMYARKALVAMKKVDPTIQVGAVLMNYPYAADDIWNKEVLAGVGDLMDFAITHTYSIGYRGNNMDVDEDRLLTAVLSATEQIESWLEQLRRQIYRQTGRKIPLAITEFNASFVQSKPKKYIFSYAAGFFSADYLRVLLKPEHHILLADYWHFLNSYFGMIQGKTEQTLIQLPAYPLFRLWADHFGDQLIQVNIRHTPHASHPGFGRTAPARGDRYQPQALLEGGDLLPQGMPAFKVKTASYHIQRSGPHSLGIQLDQVTGNHYPNLFKLSLPESLRPSQTPVKYQLSFDMRFVSDSNQSAPAALGLGLMDGRGWKRTHSAVKAVAGQPGFQWQSIEAGLTPLPDIKEIVVLSRLECDKAPITGRLEIRNVQLKTVRPPIFPAYAALTASASRSNDGKKVYLIVFNKHPRKDIEAALELDGMKFKSVRFWQVSNPSLNAFNTPGHPAVKLIVDGKAIQGNRTHLFPARSMTAIEWTKN